MNVYLGDRGQGIPQKPHQATNLMQEINREWGSQWVPPNVDEVRLDSDGGFIELLRMGMGENTKGEICRIGC